MMKHTTSSTPNNHRQAQPPRHALHHSRHLFGICTRSTSILTPRTPQHYGAAATRPQSRIKRAVLGVTTMAFVAIMFRQTTVWSHAFYHRLFTPLVVDVDVDVEVDPTSYQQHQQQQPLFHLVISNAGPDETLSRLNLRCIESIFYFHPHAHVLLHTNHEKGLRSGNQHPQLAPLIHRGYHLEVRPYRPEQMLQAAMHYSSSLQQHHDHHQRYNIDTTLATAFLANLSTLQHEKYWYANEANLVRLCVLYLHGGIYVDTDVIFINHKLATLPLANAMSRHRDGTKFHNAVMKFEKANPFLSATLNTMMRHFNGTKWGNNGPKAFGRTAQQFPALICSPLDTMDIDNYNIDNNHNNHHPTNRDVTTTTTANETSSCWVHPLPNEAVAPVSYKDWHKVCFAETAPTYQQAKHLLRNSMVVHLNNKVTGKDLDRQAYRPDSLCHYVLTNYCVLCHE